MNENLTSTLSEEYRAKLFCVLEEKGVGASEKITGC
jgi:hypothetical protein